MVLVSVAVAVVMIVVEQDAQHMLINLQCLHILRSDMLNGPGWPAAQCEAHKNKL